MLYRKGRTWEKWLHCRNGQRNTASQEVRQGNEQSVARSIRRRRSGAIGSSIQTNHWSIIAKSRQRIRQYNRETRMKSTLIGCRDAGSNPPCLIRANPWKYGISRVFYLQKVVNNTNVFCRVQGHFVKKVVNKTVNKWRVLSKQIVRDLFLHFVRFVP